MKRTFPDFETKLAEAYRLKREETKQCEDDSCNGSHCAKCGCHMMGWSLEHGAICEGCKMLREHVQLDCQVVDFDDSDVIHHGTIICLKSDLIRNEPDWMKQGLQETATGYGARLNSGYMIRFKGRVYRIYTTCYSNNGSCWFKAKGIKIFVSAH